MGWWRELVGPSREMVWQELAAAVGAKYDSRFLSDDSVRLETDGSYILLDTYAISTGNTTASYTRLRAPFYNPNNFYMNVYRKSIFSPIGKFFGVQDLPTGHADFDRDFIVQSNSLAAVRSFLAGDNVRALIASQPQIALTTKDKSNDGEYGANVDVLEFSCAGVIKDLARLRDLFDLFARALVWLEKTDDQIQRGKEAGEPASSARLRQQLESELHFLAPHLARRTDHIEVHGTLAAGDFRGTFLVGIPHLPVGAASVRLIANVPPAASPYAISPVGWRVIENLSDVKAGHQDFDDAYLVEGDASCQNSIRTIAERFFAMGTARKKTGLTLEHAGERLIINAQLVPAEELAKVSAAMAMIWRDIVSSFSG